MKTLNLTIRFLKRLAHFIFMTFTVLWIIPTLIFFIPGFILFFISTMLGPDGFKNLNIIIKNLKQNKLI